MAKIKGNRKDNKLKGTKKADQIYGLAGDDLLKGRGGDDLLDAGKGDDVLKGGGGDDTMIAGTGKQSYSGGAGVDTVSYAKSKLAVEIEMLLGTGTGAAQFDKFKSIENIDGSAFNDRIDGDNNANRLFGLNGNDTLRGLGGNDTIDGGAGNDLIDGGAGADKMNGGLGSDTLTYSKETSAGATINLTTGKGGGSALGDTFTGFEIVIGTKFSDTITGAQIGETLNGFLGGDTIYGGGGNDVLVGDEGADKLYGGNNDDRLRPGDATVAEADQLFGGAGDDWVDYGDAGAMVQVDLRNGIAGGRALGDTYNSIENVQGSQFKDSLIAGTGGRAYGGAGDDIIFDAGGTEILRGEGGADFLSDVAGGEDGKRDIFVLEVGRGKDTVQGFTHLNSAAGDRFWLPKSQFGALKTNADGTLKSGQVVSHVVGNDATIAGAQFIFNKTSKTLYYDEDGTGAAAPVALADVVGLVAIATYDFVVVPNL